MGHVRIRPARPADAHDLGHLHLDVWEDAYTGLMPQAVLDERRADPQARVGQWRTILAHDHTTLVAEDHDGLVGFASSGPAREEDPPVELELWALYVRASRWGTGVGYALCQQAIGERAAYLWVLEGNDRSMRFYERQGFHTDGATEDTPHGRHLRMVRP